jgi:hypothetical protein
LRELYNKYRPLVPQPYQDTICPKPPQEVLDNQKKIKNEQVRAKTHSKKKKPAKKEKEEKTTADETREEEGGEESENVKQQVVAVVAAAGPHTSSLVPAAVPPGMPWIPQFNPNPYFYGGFNPFSTNSFDSNR